MGGGGGGRGLLDCGKKREKTATPETEKKNPRDKGEIFLGKKWKLICFGGGGGGGEMGLTD